MIKRNTTWRMTGSKPDLQLFFTQFDRCSGLEISQRTFVIFERQSPVISRLWRISQQRFLLFMYMKGQSPGIVYEFIAKDMVEMAMGIKQQNGLSACLFDTRF